MNNPEDILQQRLEALEAGADLGEALAGLPGGNEEIASLLQLAQAVRNLPHPEPLVESAQAWQLALQKAAPQAVGLPVVNAPGVDGRGPRQAVVPPGTKKRFPFNLNFTNWLPVPAVAGALALILIVFAGLIGLSSWLYFSSASARVATLMDVKGVVEVAATQEAGWQVVTDGERVVTGQRLRTGPRGQVTLLFFDGSRTTLGPKTDLTLTRVDGGWGKVIHVVLDQSAGKTAHSVAPFGERDSSFMVFTPSGAASVHGTRFNVAVGQQGKARFAVEAGQVLVTNLNSERFLGAGQAVAVQAGIPLEVAMYQFSLRGKVGRLQGDRWYIQGAAFGVTPETEIAGDPQVGDWVSVEGRVLTTGEWVADSLEPTDKDKFQATFTGAVEAIGGERWQIGGKTVLVNANTKIGAGLAVGDPVKVRFRVMQTGEWLALEVAALEGEPDKPAPAPTPTPSPAADPVLAFVPDHLEGAGCRQDEFEFKGGLANLAAGPDDVAAKVALGYAVTQGAKFVNAVKLNPAGWEAIPAGGQVEFELAVKLDEDGWGAAPAGTAIELRVFIAQEANTPEGHDTRLVVTLTKDCKRTLTPTPVTRVTGTVTVTASPTGGATDCTGANPHPTGLKLAQRYGVPYQEVMGWFCQHFGFGEIDLAYGLSRQYGVPVADIFALRKSGLGWGQIKKMLPIRLTGTPTTTGSPTATPTGTLTVMPSATPQPPGPTTCTGANPHPTGMTLAQRFGVPYAEIMGWFCQGFGFGEIDLAYGLSQQYGVPVSEIFGMRTSGMGWGEIKKSLSQPPPVAPDHGKPDKGKPKKKDP